METPPTEPWNLADDPRIHVLLLFTDPEISPVPGTVVMRLGDLTKHITETVYQAVSQRLRDEITTDARAEGDRSAEYPVS